MAQVLAPCLEPFRAIANLFTEFNKGVSEAVRVEIRQSGRNEGIFEYGTDGVVK